MLLYRFRIWIDDDNIVLDDDVYRQDVGDKMDELHRSDSVYQIIIPPENTNEPTIHCILSDNREKIIEYIRGFSLALELIPSQIPITVKKNPFRVAVPQEDAEVAK